jgi:hypothetical protein
MTVKELKQELEKLEQQGFSDSEVISMSYETDFEGVYLPLVCCNFIKRVNKKIAKTKHALELVFG